MPNVSGRQQALRELSEQIQTLADDITEAQVYQHKASHGTGRRIVAVMMEEMRELVLAFCNVASHRYSVPRIYGARGGGRHEAYTEEGTGYVVNIMESLLERFPQVPFHKMFRVKKEEFDDLVDILEGSVDAGFWGRRAFVAAELS
jgi:hypothetical protein